MRNELSKLLSGLVTASFVLAACTPAATPTAAPAATDTAMPPSGKVCEVTDTGGVDDKSFNATAWAGAQEAGKKFNWEATYLESQQQTDYEKNITEFTKSDCTLIVTVGFLLGDATLAAAKAAPDQKFMILDYAYNEEVPNVWQQVYATDQGAFLAGYIAASATKTGKVATFGGINIPPVVDFMDGFYMGVMHYNEKHGTNVEVLGWDPATPDLGLFIGNFDSTDQGRQMGETLMDEGADVIMPVAGPVGLGTAEAIKARGNAWLIGVDTDWTVSAAEYKDIILTSVLKKLDVTVVQAVEAVNGGSFSGGLKVADLKNGGIGVTTSSAAITDETREHLTIITEEIIAGTLATKP